MQTPPASDKEFDVIVLGVGGMGSATCLELARRGMRVLGLERFPLVHDRGSSHGESRIIRKAYFEHPDYVPLLHRAYDLWHDLEQATNRTLFHPTGLLLSGLPESETIRGARYSASQHALELEDLTVRAAEKRFPGLRFPVDHEIAFEPGAGTLFVDACVQAQVDEAIRQGAVLRGNEQVIDWSTDGTRVQVRSTVDEYFARKLVVTAGPWSSDCLADLGLKLKVLRKFVAWFPVKNGEYQAAKGLPTYFFELPEGTFYGFPSFDGGTVKVAEHSGGDWTNDPLNVDRECHPHDFDRLSRFLLAYLPGVKPTPARHSVCLYTLSEDQHFIIELHPRWKNVAFAAGFSGHGFKFCPVVGVALADLVQLGHTPLPINFLAKERGKPEWLEDD